MNTNYGRHNRLITLVMPVLF